MTIFYMTEYPTQDNIHAHVEVFFFINLCMLFISTSTVVARVFSRLDVGAGLHIDDFLAIFSSVQGLGLFGIQAWWMTLGEGFPIGHMTEDNLVMIKKLLIAFELLYATTTATIKLSILCFYLRMFCARFSNQLKTIVKGVMASIFLWSVANILQVFLICHPFQATFDDKVVGTCGNQVASYIAIGCFNAVSDLVVLGLPITTLWTLRLKMVHKFCLSLVFLLGLSATTVAVVRMISLSKDLHMETLTQSMVWPAFWTNLEVDISVICVNLPALGFVVKNLQRMVRRATSRRARPARERAPSPFPSLTNPRVPFGQHGPFEEIELLPQIYRPTAPPPPRYGLRAIPNPMFANRPRTQHTSWCERGDRESAVVPVGGIGVRTEWAVEFSGERS
ncbi:hypothetical protein V8F20_007127 [Naviculisporaceae sp. PSN 640]